MSKGDIEYRMSSLGIDTSTLTAVERSRKIKSLQVTESKLKNRIMALNGQIRQAEKDLSEANRQMSRVIEEQNKLSGAESPVITEHALLRYVERYWGVDLEKAHSEILQLPDSDKVIAKSTIVTVFPNEDDHFNLAERESM